MTRSDLIRSIQSKKSCLCVGLDLDVDKMPAHLSQTPEGWLEFNQSIIDATREYCVAYKPNWAFYEALGIEGLSVLQKTISYIGEDHLIIADAKRGDIGNTSNKYAQSVFETFGADAITVAPYMGIDSLEPFRHPGKWLIALALTSNPGSADFQRLKLANGKSLFEEVLTALSASFSKEEMMFVVGATHPQDFAGLRKIVPEHFLLVPGVGAQGGDLEGVMRYGATKDGGLLINSSRGIIYASADVDFADAARMKAMALQKQMAQYL